MCFKEYRVSIPHRQDKNYIKLELTPETEGFQSLIGRIKTITHPKRRPINFTRFQSLIGRIKTYQDQKGKRNGNEFQSLIGRIKTQINFSLPLEIISVSIPHRQDKNWIRIQISFSIFMVSIPHRQDKNMGEDDSWKAISMFQSLIGRIKT